MSLENLVGVSLERITPAKQTVGRLLKVRLDISPMRKSEGSALRKQRNLTEYTGDTIPESALGECLRQAESLQAAAMNWLQANRPDLS